MAEVRCYKCKTITRFENNLGFREECLQCREDLHSCKNCMLHDPKAYNECREPTADVVRERDRANYCEFFQAQASDRSADSAKEALMAAAEALFKK